MAEKAKDRVEFLRGGKRVALYKSPNLFSVRLREGRMPESLASRMPAALGLTGNLRFVRRHSNHRSAVYRCRPGERDRLMQRLREQKEVVQYCSHVLQRAPEADEPEREIGLDNKLFVRLRGAPARGEIAALEAAHALRLVWRFPEAPRALVFELTERAQLNPVKIANRLATHRRVRTAEPCLIEAKIGRALPSDEGFRAQWHLLNTGQGSGKPGADCNAAAAWDYTWGDKNVCVALIDDGFDLSHPDFSTAGKIVAPYDATQHDTDPAPETMRENHGTACAGVAIAARGAGAAIGVAPDCRFMPIRHAGELGDYDEAMAFRHAQQNGAHVISCSWGPPDAYRDEFWPMPSLTRTTIEICVRQGRGGRGIPVLFAAGNGNEPVELDGYANDPLVIAVAACTNLDTKAEYSDYGRNVWVCAPSNGGTLGIFTTDRTDRFGYHPTADYTDDFGGTSSATPLVAGVAALMLSVNPELTEPRIRRILKKTAVKINRRAPRKYEDTWGNAYGDRYDRRGHSKVFGWGRVDAGAAVAEALRIRRS